jgi:hypothetical protein
MQTEKVEDHVPIVEHDAADFDAFDEQLRKASCWKVVNKKITGN